ncbi:flagellar basal body-associated protein FliL [Clostridium sp. BJN0013]|uniref:flagellar basal body-associated protein FliL n=1 Tax=Clostridium sp. BJN0013 TaxID=3236840 RepID=UPI0034C6887A
MENKEKKKDGVGVKVILIVFFLVAAVGAGAFFGYSKFLSNKNTDSSENMAASNVAQTQTQSGENSSYLQHVVSAKTFDLSEFTVNLADEGGKNYLKVNVYLGYDDKKLTNELTEKTPIIRDAIIEILRTKKVEDISDKNMDNIKIEIIQRINPMLEKGKINNVYFSDILTQ